MTSEYDPKSLEGIPESGQERLAQNRAGLYTSDLSVNEFLLVTEAGFDPVGLVVGSSIFHIGVQLAGWTSSRELDVLSQAMYSARQLAMTRMEEEADELGADGIVGVRLDIGRYEWGPNMPSSSRSAPRSSTGRASSIVRPTAGRSRATCPVRISGRCCAPGTGRSGW